MDPDLATVDIAVVCECGATYKIASPCFERSIPCTMCGRQIRLCDGNTHRAHEQIPTAILRMAEHSDLSTQLHLAVRFVKEHQFDEAIDIYKHALQNEATFRDIFYGLGYCYFRKHMLQESRVLLRLALDMGHPSAETLLRRVRGVMAEEDEVSNEQAGKLAGR